MLAHKPADKEHNIQRQMSHLQQPSSEICRLPWLLPLPTLLKHVFFLILLSLGQSVLQLLKQFVHPMIQNLSQNDASTSSCCTSYWPYNFSPSMRLERNHFPNEGLSAEGSHWVFTQFPGSLFPKPIPGNINSFLSAYTLKGWIGFNTDNSL